MALGLVRPWLAAIGVALSACQPAEEPNYAAPTHGIAKDEFGYPTRQPTGSPLTAEFCASEEAGRIYDNIKTCSMVACSQGNRKSCEIAATFATQHAPENEPE